MLLAIEAGNARVKVALMTSERVVARLTLSTASRTADEWAAAIARWMGTVAQSRASIHGAAVASVVPGATQPLTVAAEMLVGRPALVVGAHMELGLEVRAARVGIDRLVNAAAARALFAERDVVLVDVGTAITVDTVTAAGAFLGGAIAPGPASLLAVTLAATALGPIRGVPLPKDPIGRDTLTGLEIGIRAGTASTVDGLVERSVAEVGDAALVVGTGGGLRDLLPSTQSIDRVEPDLGLIGVSVAYDLNERARRARAVQS